MSSYFSTRPPVLTPPKICKKPPPRGPFLPAWPPTRLIASIVAERTGPWPYQWDVGGSLQLAMTFPGSWEYHGTVQRPGLDLLVIGQLDPAKKFMSYWFATRLGTQVGHGTSDWDAVDAPDADDLEISVWPDVSPNTTALFTFFFQPNT